MLFGFCGGLGFKIFVKRILCFMWCEEFNVVILRYEYEVIELYQFSFYKIIENGIVNEYKCLIIENKMQ